MGDERHGKVMRGKGKMRKGERNNEARSTKSEALKMNNEKKGKRNTGMSF